MPVRSLKFHFYRLLLGVALVLLLAWVTGFWLETLALALLLSAAWLLVNTWRLYRWLTGGRDAPPESLGVWSDIFDRIDALQKQNRKQQERYQSVIREFQSMTDAFPDATLVLDAHDCITWFNDAACSLLGLRVPEDLGQPVTNLLRDPDFANWMAVEGKVQSHFEMASPLDSNVHLSINAVRYREDQRLLIVRDVTDIHNVERIRRDFVANVSHELRTPLTVLLGYLESMQDQCPEDLSPAVERMRDQARQMQNLLNDLLELSRLQTTSHESEDLDVDVPAMLMQLKEQAEELSQGNHDLRFEVDPDLLLRGAATDLESAFRNLINNAIHYTPDGGSIRISWRDTPRGPEFSVTDTGIGIPKRDIPRLTERFYRVGSDRSRHRGGTGLGLSIVKHVLNAHDSRLSIESELGEGSTFTCVFPPGRRVEPENNGFAEEAAPAQ